jgi:hypothetical protein
MLKFYFCLLNFFLIRSLKNGALFAKDGRLSSIFGVKKGKFPYCTRTWQRCMLFISRGSSLNGFLWRKDNENLLALKNQLLRLAWPENQFWVLFISLFWFMGM